MLVKTQNIRLATCPNPNTSSIVNWISESHSTNNNNVFLNDVDPVNSLTQELTTLTTVEDTIVDSQLTHNVQDDPYPDKTPFAILEREYLIASFNISSDSQNFISPINLLLGIPTIRAYLRNFRYLRCGFKIKIETITTPMQFGALGVSWLPYTDLDQDVSLTAQSQSSMHVLDLTQQESLDLALPYLRPPLYYDLTDASHRDWRVGFYGFVVDTVTAGSPSAVSVNIFASMTEPEAAGYLPVSGVFQSKRGISSSVPLTALGVMAASMYAMGGNHDFVATTENVEVPSENAKLSLLGDIATPSIHSSTTCTRLGDSTRPKKVRSRTSMDIYGVGEISTVPVHTITFALSNTVPTVIDLTPFPTMSHSSYVKEMFKYFRGGSKILLKFVSSPMMSARVVINLYTTGVIRPPEESIGDVMSWVLSVKGSQDWAIEVPYLQKRSWQSTDMQDFVVPKLTVSLLDPLPQPYDKTVSLYCIAFQSAGDDLCFAGLESFVPRDPTEGVFQSVSGSISSAIKLGNSSSHPYQGANLSVADIVGRFGSRDGNPENYFPFPIRINNWTQGYELDNFDYVAQLYAFYTGDTHIKMLFSAAPAGGSLNVVFGNSKNSVFGNKFKAGNSMVVSHQGVWPVVEFTFPYMCEDEFNSIRYPVGMYPQDYDWSATVSSYLISATRDFSLHYLMPVPEFFRSARPSAVLSLQQEGIFQSRITTSSVYCTRLQPSLGVTNPVPITFASNPLFGTGTFTLDVQVVMTRLSGADDCITHIHVGKMSGSSQAQPPANGTTAYPNTLVCLPIAWIDSSNSGKNFARAQAVKSFAGLPAFSDLTVGLTQSTSSSTFRYDVIVTVSPWHFSTFLLNPSDTTLTGKVQSDSTISSTLSVSVVNVPAVTLVGPSPLPVNISSSSTLPVLITNAISNPVPVVLDSGSEIAARIQGVVDPDTPIWTTSYK